MDLTAEQKAEFDSLFKSFMEIFKRECNEIRSLQIKINEQVKSIEVKNDKFFHGACARLSEPESPDRSSNSTPTSQTDIDEEKLSSAGDESEINQSTRDGTKQSFENGKSFLSPILSPGIQYEAVSEDEFATGEPIAFTSESPLFDRKAFLTGNTQTGPDVFGVSEGHYAPVPDQLPIVQCTVLQNQTSVDSNFPQSVGCSPDEARVENENPFPSDEYSESSSVTQNLAASNVSVSRTSDRDQSLSLSISGLAGLYSLTQETSAHFLLSGPPMTDKRTHSAGSVQPSIPRYGPGLGSGPLEDFSTQEPSHFLITDPPVCDGTMHNASVLPPLIPRHGPDLQNDHFVSNEPGSERSKAQTLTSFSLLGKSDVGSFTQEAFIVTGPLPMPSRYGKDTRPNVSSGTNQVSEAIVAQILALSFPKHGPDENITSFVGTSVLRRSVLGLPFPKHRPDILAFSCQFTSDIITQALLSPQSVGRTSAIRMAEGREAYGRLRPVRRPWF